MKKTVEIRAAQTRAVALLKGELKNRNLTYGMLAHRLAQAGLRYDKVNVANKIRMGTFLRASGGPARGAVELGRRGGDKKRLNMPVTRRKAARREPWAPSQYFSPSDDRRGGGARP